MFSKRSTEIIKDLIVNNTSDEGTTSDSKQFPSSNCVHKYGMYRLKKNPKRMLAQVVIWLRYRLFTVTILEYPTFPIKSKFLLLI